MYILKNKCNVNFKPFEIEEMLTNFPILFLVICSLKVEIAFSEGMTHIAYNLFEPDDSCY